jgi:hypothetical protein
MRKTLPLFLAILLASCLLSGVNDETLKKFEKTQIVKEKQVEVVKLEAMKPDIERYQKKTSTYLSGSYHLYKNNIRNTNKVLLNKWLKEFK